MRNRLGLARCGVLSVLIAAGCTEPQTRTTNRHEPLSVRIDADSAVRERVLDVEATVESQRTGEGDWRLLVSRHKQPTSDLDWPYTFETDPITDENPKSLKFQLTARARDSRGAVLAQARVVTTYELALRDGLRVLFDSRCLDRTELCGTGMTCTGGQCVDATYDPNATRQTATMMSDAVRDEPNAPSEDGLAKNGDGCTTDGEKRCAAFGSAQPLRCVDGMWQAQMECTAAERCDTSNGPTRGTCKRMAPECAGQQADVPFCDSTMMRVCNADLLASIVRPCADQERCTVEGGDAQCLCQPGFVKEPSGCMQSNDCKTENGGCDPVTDCSVSGGKRVCSACPPGFIGSGATGCTPVLDSFKVDPGLFSPGFTPNGLDYDLAVPLTVQRLTVTATTLADAQLKINGSPVASGEAWLSPVLTLGVNNVAVEVITEFASNTYHLTIVRAGEQRAYVKASNARASDVFGTCLSASNDTIVIGASGEDSAATGVNGDQSNAQAHESGAAYVLVRSGTSWKQQAYLKPLDTASGDWFAFGCAVEGDTIAVGAMRRSPDPTDLPTKSGSVYVYARSNGTWSVQQELKASDASVGDAFGIAVAIEGDVMLVGASLQGSLGARYGAAYVFTRSGGMWTEQQKIAAPQPRDYSEFGQIVALAGDTIAISAQEDSAKSYRGGAVYVFTRTGGKFGNPQRLDPQPAQDQTYFGFAMSLEADRLAVGAPQVAPSDGSTQPSGKVWIYERAASGWQQSATVTAPLEQTANSFGSSVSLSGDSLLIGASGENGSSHGIGGDQMQRDAKGSGAAYLYAFTDEGWKFSTYLKASNGRAGDSFGYMAALTPTFAVVAAELEDGSGQGINSTSPDATTEDSGAAYVFE